MLRCLGCFALASLDLAQEIRETRESSWADAAVEWIGDFALRAGSDRLAATAAAEEVAELRELVRLAQIAYEDDTDTVSSLLPDGLTLRDAGRERAVWFMAQRRRTVFLVFRGTSEWKDIFADMQVLPDLAGKHRLHGGFASHVSKDGNPILEAALAALPKGCELHILGHSLGGAVALALLASGQLPRGLGHVDVTMIGSPKVFHGVAPSVRELGARRVKLLVNHGDIVPRLLGNEKVDVSRYLKQLRQLEIRDEDLPALADYCHPAGLELVVLRGAAALKPSPAFHDRIWLDPTALAGTKRDPFTDHLMTEYMQSLDSLDPSRFGRSGLVQTLRDLGTVFSDETCPDRSARGCG
ncbi:unnamed protein product [Symbiodinium natans]|uniref:Fungal lipase-type domain-containing protein n=1 Tax=Symbiodinium natans TaxID=878477 RepID=A0A812JYJ1_9DINO|nr:unnamed protein product [Symbiodinium natans]